MGVHDNHHPTFLSVYSRVLIDFPKTTNSFEGYNLDLNYICKIISPMVLALGREFVSENEVSNKKIQESNTDFWATKHSREQNMRCEIGLVVMNYSIYYDVEYLVAVFRNFKFLVKIKK